jgi:hypothetical protein
MASVPGYKRSAIRALPLSLCLPETTIRAPSLAKGKAVARPIPVSAPVTRTTGAATSFSVGRTVDDCTASFVVIVQAEFSFALTASARELGFLMPPSNAT